MDKEGFDALFEERLAYRLALRGFASTGKTLIFSEGRLTIALVRLGGKMMSPGGISHILCFRHSFLRDMTETVPAGVPKSVFDYPYKLKPIEDAKRELMYRPQNLNYAYERLDWENADESSVNQKLDHIASHIEDRFLPWAKRLPLQTAMSQIEQYGENAWCERMWLEDYAAQDFCK